MKWNRRQSAPRPKPRKGRSKGRRRWWLWYSKQSKPPNSNKKPRSSCQTKRPARSRSHNKNRKYRNQSSTKMWVVARINKIMERGEEGRENVMIFTLRRLLIRLLKSGRFCLIPRIWGWHLNKNKDWEIRFQLSNLALERRKRSFS